MARHEPFRNVRVVLAAPLLVALAASSASAQLLDRWHDGASPRDEAGFCAAVPDVDGDGVDDYLVGAPGEANVAGFEGSVRLRSGATGNVIHEVLGDADSERFGAVVANAGDFDGDGVADFIVGDPYDDRIANDGGTFVLYSGSSGYFLLSGDGVFAGMQAGSAVSALGDITGDGHDEFAVAFGGHERVDVWADTSAASIIVWTWTGQAGGRFGSDLAAAGDVDGDGLPDLVVGEPAWDGPAAGEIDVGRAIVYSGATGLAIWEWAGDDGGDRLGSAVDGVGDVDADGYADVIVGAPLDDANGTDAGAAIVYSGRTGLPLVTLTGDPGTRFADRVAGVGDLDRDAIGDFAVAATTWGGIGRITSFSGATGTKLHDYDHTQGAGWGEVDGGDFDGDGDSDLVLGTPSWTTPNTASGRVELYRSVKGWWSIYDAGWPGTFGVAKLEATRDPALGDALDVELGNSLGASTLALLLIGLDETSLPTSKDGTLLVKPILTLLLKLDAGGITLGDKLPDDPALIDLDLYLQAIELDDGASKGLSFTAGLRLHLGIAYP